MLTASLFHPTTPTKRRPGCATIARANATTGAPGCMARPVNADIDFDHDAQCVAGAAQRRAPSSSTCALLSMPTMGSATVQQIDEAPHLGKPDILVGD